MDWWCIFITLFFMLGTLFCYILNGFQAKIKEKTLIIQDCHDQINYYKNNEKNLAIEQDRIDTIKYELKETEKELEKRRLEIIYEGMKEIFSNS